MKKTIALVTFLIITNTINCLKSNDLCRREKECRGQNNSNRKYKMACRKLKCIGKYSYHCEADFCTPNKKLCEEFINLRLLIQSIVQTDIRDLRKYKNMIKNIKECAVRKYDLGDICLNEHECTVNNTIAARMKSFAKSFPNAKCKCSGELAYHCGRKFCSLNKSVCDKVLGKNLTSSIRNQVKSCVSLYA